MDKLLDKIKNQSTLIVIILLIYSYFALKGASSFTSPIVVSGLLSFFLSVFLLIANFFVIQISESYKNIIEELKGVINTLKSQQKFTAKHYKDILTETQPSRKEIAQGYTTLQEDETKND